jgi:hypothetical protein
MPGIKPPFIAKPLCILAVLAGLVACGNTITLAQRGAVAPAGTDLTGQWLLRRDRTDSNAQIARAGSRAVEEQVLLPGPREDRARRPARSKGGLVHVFLETGDALKITQTAHGLFISFDRAIVEEYRFGEMREVNVGPVVAKRASGWDGDSYVIQTLDSDGVVLTERYELLEGGNVLIRRVVIEKRDSRQLDVRQVFDRQAEPG